MSNFKNIITLLNNTETIELGSTLAVSQGMGKQILSFYRLKRSRQNFKSRMFTSKTRSPHIINSYSLDVPYLKKLETKRGNIKNRLARRRLKLIDVILNVNNALLNSLSN